MGLLRQILRITSYAFTGFCIHCLSGSASWAQDSQGGNVHQQDIENILLSANNKGISQKPGGPPSLAEAASLQQIVTGTVKASEDEQGLPGVNVVIKGTTIGTVTDMDGNYRIEAPSRESVLVFSSIGFLTQEVTVGDQSVIDMTLAPDVTTLGEIIVVGYGEQKKASVVGSIAQTSGTVLQRTGGVSNIGSALTGNLPGVTTMQGTGAPGDEDPMILIRGQGTWNNSSPLILVDGVERPMNGLDLNSIESISVLKDASATAVFGVKGANGVILITTKRGKEGKANINVILNSTVKVPSRLPQKYDSYDALHIRNRAIERELAYDPSSWENYTPYPLMDRYRNPESPEMAERYPNVDWIDETVRDYAMSYNANVNVSGGTSFVNYFTSIDYQKEGDMMRVWDNDKSYSPGYGLDRINIRSNLDFNLTSTTRLRANLAGLHSNKQDTWSGFESRMWQAAYGLPPDVTLPKYSDGVWGYYPDNTVGVINSAQYLANSGIRNLKTTQINTDFTLFQDLGMVLKGLSADALFSMDNTFVSEGGIFDSPGNTFEKWVTPGGEEVWRRVRGANQFDFVMTPWEPRADEMRNWDTRRKTFYQIRVNYAKKFGKHDVTAMGLFSRDQFATGDQFPFFREDWVFRTTYNYDLRFFAEFNGAYNGSERFGRQYRFDFFPSAALGWMVSEESLLKEVRWLDMFKIRGSYGMVGDDNIDGRWQYMTQWAYGQSTKMGEGGWNFSPYNWYREDVIGNPDLHWEKVAKGNIGAEFSLFNGLIDGSFDYFDDYRTNILIAGGQRAVPDYFGGTPPVANLGRVRVRGYELELRLHKQVSRKVTLWLNSNITHAKDVILDADDPQLLPDYQKQAGFQIGQHRSYINRGFYNNWDEVYGSTPVNVHDAKKMPGNFNYLDFNGDGVIDDYDIVPYAFPERPQNTYNATFGIDIGKFSAFAQFYGVNNVTRNMTQTNFPQNLNTVFRQGEFWSPENQAADLPWPRWNTETYSNGNFYLYDGSFWRLKTAELAYTFDTGWASKAGIQNMRVYLSGNNLLLWTQMPDDRESNMGEWGGTGAYPTVRRVTLGVNLML